MSFTDTYISMPYPWISQTIFKHYMACPYMFKRLDIDGYNPEESKRTMKQGTALHKFYYMFFDNVDFNYLWDLGYETNNIRFYFLTVLRNLVNVEKITDSHFIRNFKAFVEFEMDHYINIRSEVDTKSKARQIWWCPPSRREIFMTSEQYMIYGTIDRLVIEDNVRIIMDYKTGTNVPKGVRDEVNSLDPKIKSRKYTKATINSYTTQAVFYAIMDALKNGYTFKYSEMDKRGNPKWNFYRGDKKLSIGDYYEYIFLWTGYPGGIRPTYYMAYKKVNIRTVRRILNKLPIIRSDKNFIRTPQERRCSWCPLYYKECKDKIKDFILFKDGEHFELY